MAGFWLALLGRHWRAALFLAASLTGVFFRPDSTVRLVALTYSELRPYSSHPYLTPHAEERAAEVEKTLASNRPAAWLSGIDYVMADSRLRNGWLDRANWSELYRAAVGFCIGTRPGRV